MIGKLFVIESGTDGSGKATQTELLYKSLMEKGYNVRKIEYPNYKSESSALVKMYLRGDFGENPDDVNAYIASTFYAVDRYASFKTDWGQFYKDGGIIIADRYTTSNMVHQASKMNDDIKKEEFLEWLYDYEYELYGLPKPTEVFFLDVPVELSKLLMKDRKNKITNDDKKDIHESNYNYLKKTYENSKFVADKYNWNIINCTENNKMKSIKDIHKDILSQIIEILK